MKESTCMLLSMLCIALTFAGCGISGKSDSGEECIADAMYTTDIEDYSFVVFRSKYGFVEADGKCLDVTFEYEDAEPQLNEGEFALITADVTKTEGGEAGYRGEPHVKELKLVEKLDYKLAVEKGYITDADDMSFAFNSLMLKHTSGDDIYIIYSSGSAYDVYLNSEYYETVEGDLSKEENLKSYIKQLDNTDKPE